MSSEDAFLFHLLDFRTKAAFEVSVYPLLEASVLLTALLVLFPFIIWPLREMQLWENLPFSRNKHFHGWTFNGLRSVLYIALGCLVSSTDLFSRPLFLHCQVDLLSQARPYIANQSCDFLPQVPSNHFLSRASSFHIWLNHAAPRIPVPLVTIWP